MTTEDQIIISQHDFGTFAICAVRYCLGRRSYMPSVIQELILNMLPKIDTNTLKTMHMDARDYSRNEKDYGDAINYKSWMDFVCKIGEEIKRREEGAKTE